MTTIPPLPRSPLVQAAAFALLTGILSALGRMLATSDGLAPMWLANVAVVAPLLRFRAIDRRVALAGAVAGFTVVYATTAPSILVAAPQLAANMAEIVIAIVLVERLAYPQSPLYAPRNLLVFFAAAGIVGPLVSAAIGAGSLALLHHPGFVQIARSWFAADALGMIMVGPLILAAGCADCLSLLRSPRRFEVLPVALLPAAMTLLVFHTARYPALFMILPTIVFAIFRLRFVGAAAGIFMVTIVATIETAHGIGPIARTFADLDDRLLFLQIFLAVLVASTMPMAAILVEREETTRRLADRERHYRLLADHSNDMIVRIGLDGVRRFVSPACRSILGYDPDELVGVTPVASIHAEDRARVERVCRSLLDGAVDPVCSYRQRRRDGTYVWLEATYRLVRDEGGEPVEFIASVRDIARRQAAELETASAMARLQENYRLLNMAEALAGVGHWRLDAINRDLFWSDEVYRIYGLPIGDKPGVVDAIGAYHPDDREAVQAHVDRALANGRPWTLRARLVRPDGTIRHVESSGQPEIAPDGTIVGVVGIFRDVSDEIAAAAELIAARDAARASAEAKSAFLATMSHEIRTPLTGVLGMIELLRSDLPAEDRARFVANLEQSATLLMTILDDVLDFSKIESGNLVIERVDFDIVDLCRNTVDLFHHAASSKGLVLSLTTPVGQKGRLSGDPVRIQQILSNLINNAIKFTAEGSVELRLSIRPCDDRRSVRIDVVDTGIGMDQATIRQIFEPFVQADASTSRRFGGTGLGLAITKRLAQAMGGSVAVTSQEGVGTRFTVDLTLDAAIDPVPAPAAPVDAAVLRPLSILLAEDNQINRALVEALARRDGHRIRCVDNGRHAVAAAADERYDVILMDIQMPEMDGIAATRAIRAGGGPCADVPIVALTADMSLDRRRLHAEAGLSGFIPKPIDSGLLRERLAAIAGGDPAPATRTDLSCRDQLLDEVKLARIAKAVGSRGAAQIIAMMRQELATRPQLIADLAAAGDRDAVMREAHSLRGAMQGGGAVRVGDIAGVLERACSAAIPLDALALELLDAAAATCAALDKAHDPDAVLNG